MCLYLGRTGSHESIFRSDRVTLVYILVGQGHMSLYLGRTGSHVSLFRSDRVT